MKAYELLLLLNPSLDEEARAAVLDKTQGVITADGGVVDAVDSWGKRKLAVEIGKGMRVRTQHLLGIFEREFDLPPPE